MRKPNFFIVGAAKAGTSSLWKYLNSHPQVFMPRDELHKEPCFFSSFGESMGLDYYLNLYATASEKQTLCGDASTAYLSDPVSAERIYAFNPDARIIILLRNPADRAYSLYNWMVQEGYEYAGSFEEALRLENIRAAKSIPNWFDYGYYWDFMYFRSGLYYQQVKRYLDLFKTNVLILHFECLKHNPSKCYQTVCAFLGIEPSVISFEVHNPSYDVYSPRLQFVLRKINNAIAEMIEKSFNRIEIETELNILYDEVVQRLSTVSRLTFFDRMFGKVLLGRIKRMLRETDFYVGYTILSKENRDRFIILGQKKTKPKPLAGRIRNALIGKYIPDIECLTALTGIDFNCWKRTS